MGFAPSENLPIPCGAGGNALDLWIAVTGQNFYAAAVDLCQRLGRPLPTKEPANAGKRWQARKPRTREENP